MKAFVKKRTWDELAYISHRDKSWEDLEREWKAKAFTTTQTASALK